MPADTRAAADLPAWPVGLVFVGYPVWWVFGLAWCAVVASALVMLALLAQRRHVELPRGFALWAGFLVFAGAAVTELDSSLRLIGYVVRVSNYLGAAVIFVYVYNARNRLPQRVALGYAAAFFATVVAGGWLGVLLPHGSLTTPAQGVIPSAIARNSYVATLIHPSFAELQQPYGSPVAFARPSAPFPYTNSWGCNAALLLPLMIAAVMLAGRGVRRRVYLVLLALAVVPAAATLNRGMFIAMGFALVYGALHYAARGRIAAVGGLILVGAGGYLAATATGVAAHLDARLQYSQSNSGRVEIYREAWRGAVQSPWLGNGGPRPSTTLDVQIGTQGQIWNVMFSYGFPALICFIGFFGYAALASARLRGAAGPWLHVTVVVTLLTIVYYGYDGPQLSLAMFAAALALRPAAADRPASGAMLTRRRTQMPAATARSG